MGWRATNIGWDAVYEGETAVSREAGVGGIIMFGMDFHAHALRFRFTYDQSPSPPGGIEHAYFRWRYSHGVHTDVEVRSDDNDQTFNIAQPAGYGAGASLLATRDPIMIEDCEYERWWRRWTGWA